MKIDDVLDDRERADLANVLDSKARRALRDEMKAAVEAARAKADRRRSGFFAGMVRAVDAHRGKDGGR